LYKLALMVHRCLQDKAPQYLSNYCVPVSAEVASRQQLRSASRHQLLLIPRYRLRTFGRRAFAVAGPTFWNSLADELRTYSSDMFKLALKTLLFATYYRIQRIRDFRGDAQLDIDIITVTFSTTDQLSSFTADHCISLIHLENFYIVQCSLWLPLRDLAPSTTKSIHFITVILL